MSKAKILLCTPSLSATGGIASWARNIFQYNNFIGDKFFNLSHFPLERSFFVDPVKTSISRRIVYGIKDYWGIIFRFRRRIRQERPDIVHITTSASFGLVRDLLMLGILKIEKTKCVIHFHFGRIPELEKRKNWEWRLINLLIKTANTCIVIDNASYKTLCKVGHKNIKFLPNPIANDLLLTLKRFPNIERINRTVLFVGHLIQTKGIFELLESCIKIPNIKLKMIGEMQPGIKERVCELADKKQEVKWVELMPTQSSTIIFQEMLSAAVFVLPSYTEGFPNVILESMACKCPIVATSVGAIPEMLDCNSSEKAGICVPPHDVSSLQNAIERMLDDNIFATKCGENARKLVEEKYSMPVIWAQLVSMWQNVLKQAYN